VAGNSDRPPAPPPAGWFADPAGSPYLRWWDGSGWTDNFIDARTGAPPAELAPATPPRGAIAMGSVSEDSAAAASVGDDSVVDDSVVDESVVDESVVDDSESPTTETEAALPAAAASVAPPATPVAVTAATTEATEPPPLTRREARARERRAEEEAQAKAEAIPLVEPQQPTKADIDALLAQPVSAARSVDSLGEVSEPDAVAAPEEAVTDDSSAVGTVGTIGIPTPDWLATGQSPLPEKDDSPAQQVGAPDIPEQGIADQGIAKQGIAQQGIAQQGSRPQSSVPAPQPSEDRLFDFAGITPTGAVPTAPAPGWEAPGSQGDGFPLALNDRATGTPTSTSGSGDRRAPAVTAVGRSAVGFSTWPIWLFAAIPLLHLALAWLVLDVLQPSAPGGLRWVVLIGPIVVYLVLAALDRAILLRAGQLDVPPVAFAIVPPVYLAVRVVRMGVAALAPLLVWVVLQVAVVVTLIVAFPQVWSAILGS